MKKEVRTVVYNEELRLEAYRFEGMVQPFSNHFHEYYVIGFVEDGGRCLSCKNQEYFIRKGDIVLFNPGDNHGCVQSDGGVWDYRGIHLSKEVMSDYAEELTGRRFLPSFSPNVIQNPEAACYLRALHERIMRDSQDFSKEESLLLLLSLLLQQYGQPFENVVCECTAAIQKACAFMESHYAQHLWLEQLCQHVGLSKSTLLRAFTRTKGITPYCYLENIRIGKAKQLLEQGVSPLEAALQTGFSDQSHFTNYFRRFIGVAPGAYRDIFTATKREEN